MVTGFIIADQRGVEPVEHSFREAAAPWIAVTLALDPLSAADR